MDPLSILSIAAAVVAFVDLGGKLLSSASKRFRDTDPVDLATSLEDLTREAAHLGHLGHRIESMHKMPESSASQNPEFDALLAELAREATIVSKDIEGLVTTLQATDKTPHQKRSSRLHLTKTSKDRSDDTESLSKTIQNAQQRLGMIKESMMSTVLTCLWADSRSTAEEILKIRLFLGDEHARRSVPATARTTAPPSQLGLSLSLEDSQRQQLIHKIWSQSSDPSDQLEPLREDIESDSAGLRLSPRSPKELEQDILHSLWTDDMGERRAGIRPAHEKTYRWIFEPPQTPGNVPSNAPPWSNFVNWLEQDDRSQIYWVTGKPGSGKSTLMKYIVESGHLENHLRRWAQGQSPKTAVFYSWNAGTDNQRSEKGLVRSILYQYLTQMPELIPAVCPRRWAMHHVFGGASRVKLPSWTEAELRQALDTLLPLARRSNHKLVLLIDGLDEFQVADNFRSILAFAEAVRSEGGAKVCASSREWNAFQDYFRMHPSLRMQDLTGFDLEQYIDSHLKESVAYAELRDSHAEDVDRLVRSLLDKARGVFLWVSIVTDAVMTGMEAGQTIEELSLRVEQLPPDLSDLYQRIWERLDTGDQTNAARLLHIFDARLSCLDARTMFAAEQPDADAALKTWMSGPALEKLVARRLRSQTKGLLEISESGVIDYLHRTARDWARAVEGQIRNALPPDFDPNLQLLLANLAILDFMQASTFEDFWLEISKCLEYASRVGLRSKKCAEPRKLCAALDRLDSSATRQHHARFQSWSRGYSLIGHHENLHWSSYQFSRTHDWGLSVLANTFLGLTSQYAILPYIEEKLEECPGLVKPRRNEISLLENALFVPGWTPGDPLDFDGLWEFPQWRFWQREALIRLLLDHGADPRAESSLIRFVCKLVQTSQRDWPFDDATARALPLYKIAPGLSRFGDKIFWEKTQAMLEEKAKGRGNSLSRLLSKLPMRRGS